MHRFEKFISRKIQTDDWQRVEVMTGDNVLMHVDATVCWQIEDVKLCAEKAAETMHQVQGTDSATNKGLQLATTDSAPMCSSRSSASAYLRPDQPPKTMSLPLMAAWACATRGGGDARCHRRA